MAIDTLSTESRFTADGRGIGSAPGSRTTSLAALEASSCTVPPAHDEGGGLRRHGTERPRAGDRRQPARTTRPRAGLPVTMHRRRAATKPGRPTRRVGRVAAGRRCRRRRRSWQHGASPAVHAGPRPPMVRLLYRGGGAGQRRSGRHPLSWTAAHARHATIMASMWHAGCRFCTRSRPRPRSTVSAVETANKMVATTVPGKTAAGRHAGHVAPAPTIAAATSRLAQAITARSAACTGSSDQPSAHSARTPSVPRTKVTVSAPARV